MDSERQQATRGAPRAVKTPGEFLKREMALLGLTATTLAEALGVHAQTIYNVTKPTDARPISPSLAVKLAKYFAEPVDFWMKKSLETAPDDATASDRQKAGTSDGNSDHDDDTDPVSPVGSAILVDFQIEALLGDSASELNIIPFDHEQVQPASYDLTVGVIVDKGFDLLSEGEWSSVSKMHHGAPALEPWQIKAIENKLAKLGDAVQIGTKRPLKPGERVVIIAREQVKCGANFLAHVGGTAENAKCGLLVMHGFQVDPGYEGSMFFTVINMGSSEIPLGPSRKLASLAIQRLAQPPRKVYQQEVNARLNELAGKVSVEIGALFSYDSSRSGATRAMLGTEQVFLGPGEDAENGAICWALDALAHSIGHENGLNEKVIKAIDYVQTQRDEMLALASHFRVPDALLTQALRRFDGIRRKDLRPLKEVVEALALDPIETVLEIMGDRDE